jgi:predicted transcriptional regulator of viral defense system
MVADRRDLRRRLFGLAAGQGGHFSAAQAREIGYSYQAQAHHVGAGNWLRVDRGLFRLAEWAPDLHDHLARWVLWSRGRGVVSHETAMSVHGLGEFESAKVHLTVPPGFRMRHPAVVLHQAALADRDVVQHAGFPLTTPTRAIIDLAAQSPDEDQLARAIAEGAERGVLTIRGLRDRAAAVDPTAALHIERALRLLESL